MKNETDLIPYQPSDLTGNRVLVFAPHPDDETFGCGGSLALHRAAGDAVKVVVLTDGVKGNTDSDIGPDAYIRLRQNETVEACQQLDIHDVEFWMYQDRELMSVNPNDIRSRMAHLLNNYQPDIVYAPSPVELHPDHRATVAFLQKAIRFCHPDLTVAFYEVSQPLIVNTLVDISSVIRKKQIAVQCYQSQLRERPYGEISFALSRFRTLTLNPEVLYAEGFFILNARIIRDNDVLSSYKEMISQYQTDEIFEALQLQDVINTYSVTDHSPISSDETDKIEKTVSDDTPTVSVIIPTCNRTEMLPAALKSVLAQTYDNFEIVVVNDGGQDVSDIIESFHSEKIRYIRHEINRGVSAARNTAIRAAKGKYIAYLDDDDQYFSNHLETLISGLADGSCKIAYSNSYEIRQKLINNQYVALDEKISYQSGFDKEKLLICNYIPTLNIMHEREILNETGMFDEQMGTHEDWDLWIRIAQKFEFKHVDEFTAIFLTKEHSSKRTTDHIKFLQSMQLIHSGYSHLITDAQTPTAQKQIQEQHFKIIETIIKDKDIHIDNLKSIIETTQKKLDDVSSSKDDHIRNLEFVIEAKKVLIHDITASKDQHISNLEAIIKSKESQYDARIRAKNDHISNLEQQVQSAGEALIELEKLKDFHIQNFEISIEKKDNSIRRLQTTVDATVSELEAIRHVLDEKNSEIHHLKRISDQMTSQIGNMDHTLQAVTAELHIIKNSKVWRWAERFRHIFYDAFLGRFPLIRKGFLTISKEGIGTGIVRTKQYVFKKQEPQIVPVSEYEAWLKKHDASPNQLARYCDDITRFSCRPKISIVMPVYNVDPKWLTMAVESVRDQIYPHWELCIADDGSALKKIRKTLSYYAAIDKRIKVKFLEKNLGISGASNEALSLASGEFVALLDHDDELTPNALFEYVRLLNQNPDIDMFYSDEDKKEMDGRRVEPYMKSDFSPDLLLSTNYICHFCMYRRSVLNDIGGFRIGYEGSQDYDLVLRFIEKTTPKRIVHVPKVLYHWRKIPGSAAAVVDAKSYAFVSAKKALTDYMTRNGIDGQVEDGILTGTYRVRRAVKKKERVSVIIPFKDQPLYLKNCISGLIQRTDYPNFEMILVDNQSSEPEMLDYLEELKTIDNIRILQYHHEFNFSAINNFAVENSDGKYVLLLNNDTEVISPGWLEAMVEHAQRKEVGVVGAKLLYPDRAVQHAGVVMGIGIASHAFSHLPPNDNGYCGLINLVRNYCAVTGACMMTRKEVYNELGGLDEKRLTIAYNDVDFCLKAVEKGYLVVYTPYAELFHHESVSRGNDNEEELHLKNPEKYARVIAEREYMANKWKKYIDNDPYYNPNLTKMSTHFWLNLR